MLPIYLRKEPTTDALTLDAANRYHGGKLAVRERDVVAYADEACTKRRARWPWWASTRPDRRHRRIMLNCFSWRAVWLPDVAV